MGFETAMLVDIILAGGGVDAHHEGSTLPFKIALIGALGIGAHCLAYQYQHFCMIFWAPSASTHKLILGMFIGP